MAKYINPAKVVTGVCRFSYANLWEAKAMVTSVQVNIVGSAK